MIGCFSVQIQYCHGQLLWKEQKQNDCDISSDSEINQLLQDVYNGFLGQRSHKKIMQQDFCFTEAIFSLQ